MDLDTAIKKRASIKKYSSKKPPIELVINAIMAASYAPSPGNLPVLKYIIVEDKKQIKDIADACQQSFVEKAPVVVVVCSDPTNVRILYEERAEKYIKQATGAAIENFLLKITDLGLASCWVGAFLEEQIRSILNIPGDKDVEGVFPVGIPIKGYSKVEKKKYDLDNRVFFGVYGESKRVNFTKIRREDL